MSTVAQAPLERHQPRRLFAEERFVLHNISWVTYERILAEHGQHRLRHTYDHGELELMSISYEHGTASYLLGALIMVLATELGLRLKGGDPITFRREALARGLEPDKLFYVRNAAAMSGKSEVDLSRDPAPDLAIEIDITNSSIPRMPIYAALRVPEVWRYDGTVLRVYELGGEGQYELRGESLSFPGLKVNEMLPFLQLGVTEDHATAVLAFHDWVREHLLPGWQAGATETERS